MNTRRMFRPFLIILFLVISFHLKVHGQKGQDLDIIFIGNSITYGAQLENPKLESPPVFACEFIRMQKGVGNVEFINQGRSGYTTVDYLPSTGGTLEKVIAATQQLHTDSKRLLVFSISLGTNDSAEKGPNGSPVNPATYKNNLKSIAGQLLSVFHGCKLIYQQPIWYSPNTYNRSKYMAEGLIRLQTYFPELQSLVTEYSQRNPDQVFIGDTKGFEFFSQNYLTTLVPEHGNEGVFYLHPNKVGAKVLGKLWGEAIYKACMASVH